MRSDRQFCGQKCRVWWYWHAGQKRYDLSPSGWGLPPQPRKGQPKTFAAALKALAESRRYAAELTAAARKMQLADHVLRSRLAQVRMELVNTRSAFHKELAELQDELEETLERLAQAEQQAGADGTEDGKDEDQALATQLQQAESEAAELRATLEEARKELSAVHAVREQEVAQHAGEVSELRAQVDDAVVVRDQLNRQNAELVQSRDLLRGQLEQAQRGAAAANLEGQVKDLRDALARAESERISQTHRAESAERALAQHEEDLKRQRQQLAAVERAHRGLHQVAESESRSLRSEKERRMAAEARVEQLTRELESLTPQTQASLQNSFAALLAENQEVRGQRDRIDAEREHLAARLLEWMSPGQYLEHAAAADYDITRDPLIRIKLEEIRVENELFRKQLEEKDRGQDTKMTARALDPKQTAVEQAYAAALSDRWGIKHKPHKRHRDVSWAVVGILLDEKSEDYLHRRAQRRIDWMVRKQGADQFGSV